MARSVQTDPGLRPHQDTIHERRQTSQPFSDADAQHSHDRSTPGQSRSRSLNRRFAPSHIALDNHKPATLLKRPPTRLPWLDGIANSRTLPGGFDNHELDDLGIITRPIRPKRGSAAGPNEATKDVVRQDSTQTHPDLPSWPLGTTASPSDGRKRLSVPAVNAKAIAPSISIESIPSVVGIVGRRVAGGRYTPSAYSVTPQSERSCPSLGSLRKKDPASYENLVASPFEQSSVPPTSPSSRSLAGPVSVSKRQSSLHFEEVVPAEPSSAMTGLQALPSPVTVGQYNDSNMSSDPSTRSPSAQLPRRVVSDAGVTARHARNHAAANRRRSIQGAVSGLHDLMEEALQVAADAARHDRTEDVVVVLNEATMAPVSYTHLTLPTKRIV